MNNFKKITFLSILSLSCLPSNADVIIKAGTTIKGLDTNEIDNPGLGITVDQETDTFTFNQDINCATFTEFISTTYQAGDALIAACNREAGAYLGENADGSITIGKNESEITVTSEGLSQDGANLLKRTSGGEVHIGENSLVTRERNGRQELYATDANGNKIPIDITNGSKLLINGRDVEKSIKDVEHSINNVGALSAALTGLPTVPTDTTLACGLGTGTYGGDFAFSGGCASKVNEKLSINYAASMTMPGQDYAGKFEDKFSARAGFVWKLGKSNKPTQISMKAKEEMKEKIYSLEEKNTNLENTVSTLMAKLERLEKIALSESKSKDLASIKLP